MVPAKGMAIVLIGIVFFAVPAASADLKVHISDILDHDAIELDYNQDVQHIQNVNLTIENTGSIGCNYRVMVQERNSTYYSTKEPLWPGDSAFFEVDYVLENVTGQINSSVTVEYCGTDTAVESFSYNATAGVFEPDSIDTTASSTTASSTEVDLDLEEGKLVPKESPPMWRAASASIEEGKAQLSYDPPIFREEVLSYYAVVDGEVVGTTDVELSEKERMIGLREVLVSLLLISVSINLYLVARP